MSAILSIAFFPDIHFFWDPDNFLGFLPVFLGAYSLCGFHIVD